MADYNSIHTGSEIDTAVSEVANKLAKTEYFSNRNILIDGEVGGVNQTNFDGVWANIADGAYGFDIWMRESLTTIKQIVEEGGFAPGAVYTLSGVGVTEQQITAPASGNWIIGGIPNTASLIQVERGEIATEFEYIGKGNQLARVERFYFVLSQKVNYFRYASSQARIARGSYPTTMRDYPSMTGTTYSNVGDTNATLYTGVNSFYLYDPIPVEENKNSSLNTAIFDARLT